jgi:hypothetical protein
MQETYLIDLLRLPFDLRALILSHGGPCIRMVSKALRDEFDGINTHLKFGASAQQQHLDKTLYLPTLLNLLKRSPKLSNLR